MDRSRWPSKFVFILAAVGSAAGIGNLWRFPALAFEHGGGAFLFAIIIANLVIGIPLLMLETGLGQMTQQGAPGAFAYIKNKFKYIGWAAILAGFVVLLYYMAVVGWGANYLVQAFTLGWGDAPGDFFLQNVLQLSSGPGEIGGLSVPVFAGLLASWAIVYWIVRKGVKSVSKVVLWTATLPFVILLVLIIRAVTLDGAMDGLRVFFAPEWNALRDPQLWLAAFGQVFFSLSLAFGIMIAYASYNKRDTEIAKSAVMVAGGNFLVSLMSGIAVFGTLGYMALQQGVTVQDVVQGGPFLVFAVFPEAINLMPWVPALFGVLFFATFLLLAVDSAFSLLEAFATAFKDKLKRISTQRITLTITLIGILGGILFSTKAGLYYLDIVDHFIVDFGLVTIGLIEVLLIGWLWGSNKLEQFIAERSAWSVSALWRLAIKFIIPITLGTTLLLNIERNIIQPYEGYPTLFLLYMGVGTLVLIVIAAYIIDRTLEPRS